MRIWPACTMVGASGPPRCHRRTISNGLERNVDRVFGADVHHFQPSARVYFGFPLVSTPVNSRSRRGCTWNRTGVAG